MKKAIAIITISVLVIACNNESKTETTADTTSKSTTNKPTVTTPVPDTASNVPVPDSVR